MKFLVSVSNHKRYVQLMSKLKMPVGDAIYVPEREAEVSDIRQELIGLAHESFILIGTFYAEEYEYLSNGRDCNLFELEEME